MSRRQWRRQSFFPRVQFLRYNIILYSYNFPPCFFFTFIYSTTKFTTRSPVVDVTVLTTITINSPTGSLWHNYCIAFSIGCRVVLFFFYFYYYFFKLFYFIFYFFRSPDVDDTAATSATIHAKYNNTNAQLQLLYCCSAGIDGICFSNTRVTQSNSICTDLRRREIWLVVRANSEEI